MSIDLNFLKLFIKATEKAAIGASKFIGKKHKIGAEDFKSYLSDQENIEPLANEEIQARKMGINSVPTFIINKQIVINGAQTSENFEIIFQKLKSSLN